MRGFGSTSDMPSSRSKKPSWTAASASWTAARKSWARLRPPIAPSARVTGLDAREADLDRRQAELDAMAARLSEQLADSKGVQDIQREASALEKRRENLDRIEKLLASEQSDVERSRHLLEEERASFAQFVQAERQRLTEDEQHAAGRSGQDPPRAQATFGRIDRPAQGARTDAIRHRPAQSEGLEMRLATEELWSRLCGTMAPAALTQSLAQIRVQLADEQRLARRELAEQKAEVQALSARLAEQHNKLAQERDELQSWAAERQKELAKQAALLGGRQRTDRARARRVQRSAGEMDQRAISTTGGSSPPAGPIESCDKPGRVTSAFLKTLFVAVGRPICGASGFCFSLRILLALGHRRLGDLHRRADFVGAEPGFVAADQVLDLLVGQFFPRQSVGQVPGRGLRHALIHALLAEAS